MFEKYEEYRNNSSRKATLLFKDNKKTLNAKNCIWGSATKDQNRVLDPKINTKSRQYLKPTECDLADLTGYRLSINLGVKNYRVNNIINRLSKHEEFKDIDKLILPPNSYRRVNLNTYRLTKTQYDIIVDKLLYENTKKVSDGIYIMKCNEFYKIGMSSDIKKRLNSIQSSNPYPVSLEFNKKTSNSLSIEKQLHEIYKHKNIRGEWFKLVDNDIKDIINYINENSISD